MTVAAAGSAIQVVPPPMSIFNPQFLSIQVFFLAIIASVSYYVFGFSLNSSKEKPAKKQAKANPIEEWLPETHKK
ncbi:Increased recombination centers protein 22 [Kluyveromyces marxianus]|nr:Increased recombination centers protein 22 [Kluyveromyces marxianus]